MRCVALLAPLVLTSLSFAADIADFGAVPDDGRDDTAAFVAALASARDHAQSTLTFHKGRYDLATRATPPDGGTGRPVLAVKGAKGLTIDGRGAELIVHDFATLFWFGNCQDITLRDLRIDYDPLPFTAGEVVATGDGTVDVRVAPGHPLNVGLRAESLLPWDPDRHRIAAGWHGDLFQPDLAGRTGKISDGVLRVQVARAMFKVGDSVVVRHQIYSNNALDFHDCRGVRLTNVTVFTCPGMALHAWGGADIMLDHFDVTPRGGRWLSSTADATHFAGVRGRVTLDGCTLESMGDDGVNVHNYYLRVTQPIDARSFHVTLAKDPRWDIPLPLAGDRIEIGRAPDPLLPLASVRVHSAVLDPVGEGKERSATITLAEAMQDPARSGDVVGDVSALPAVTIHGCTIGRNRARGVLIQTRKATVDHNTVQDISGAAIQVTADASFWFEGMPARDVAITDNTIRRVNFSIAARTAAVDVFAEVGRPAKPAGAGAHQGVRIERNTIEDVTGAGVHVSSARDVRVTGNRIVRPTVAGVVIDHAEGVAVEGNQVTGGVPDVVRKD